MKNLQLTSETPASILKGKLILSGRDVNSALICADATAVELLCHFAFSLPSVAGPEMMYMPAGVQEITPSQEGRPVRVRVMVDEAGAIAIETQRRALAAKGKRPYFDFNHEDGPASFWPTEFFWKPDGIYARGEWSRTGRDGVEGKEWRAFSPVFHVNDVRGNPARIVAREHAKPNMGGLVNDPAFTAISPFWAKDSTGGIPLEENNEHHTIMKPEEIAALKAKIQRLEKERDDLLAKESALKAKNETDAAVASALVAKEAEIKLEKALLENGELKAKAKKLEEAETARREQDADKAIAEAVARGAIAAKDEDAKKSWKALIVADPGNAALLAKVAGNPALEARRVTSPQVTITSEGAESVFAALGALIARNAEAGTNAEKTVIARDIAAIYAKEFRGDSRLLDAPLQAANTLGTVAGTLVTLRSLELLKLAFPVLSAISTDFSPEAANFNQQIVSRIIGIPSVQTYDADTGWADANHVATDVPVTISAHKGVPITFNANELASTVRRLFDESAPAAAYALAKDMVDAVYALITAANFTAAAVTAELADFDRAKVIDMGTALNLRGVPMGAMNRSLLLYSTYYGRLAQDQAIVSMAAFRQPGVITDGGLPEVHGFRVIDAPNLPAGGGDAVRGFGFSKSALVLATRVPNDYTSALPGASNGNVTVVTLPDTGISVQQVQYVDHKLGRATQRIALMYGVAKGQVNAGQILTE